MKPGLYDGLSDEEYHADPALSSSGARKLLPPSCPALFKWERDNGQPPKAVFDFGKAAHAQVLGTGADVVVIDVKDWRTNAAKAQRDEAHAAGKVPLLAAEWDQVAAMASALLEHPIASALLDRDRGRPEVSAFWRDEVNGVDRRCRFDWLPNPDSGRLILPDYKTAASAEPRSFAKSAASFGYHQQAAWYMDTAVALGLAEPGGVSFVFVVQEKTAPYLVTVCELDPYSIDVGRRLNDRACQVFAECTATDTWPSYSDDVELVYLPPWAYKEDVA